MCLALFIYVSDLGMEYTVFAMVAKAFVTIGFNSIYVYTSELFPTEVRSIGVGTASMCARISGMIAPYLGSTLVRNSDVQPVIVVVFSNS